MMYIPAHFEVTDTGVLHDVIVKHPLGTWIVSNGDDLTINHVPFMLDAGRNVLIGHVARANPAWTLLKDSTQSAVVFHAEQGYVSPNWYPSKQVHHRVVPTWNYAVVHVHGIARTIDNRAALLNIVSTLTDAHESNQAHPWKVTDAPSDYIDKLLGAIVGIEIQINAIQGKFKLSQNRSSMDQEGVIAGLQSGVDDTGHSLANRMQQSGK